MFKYFSKFFSAIAIGKAVLFSGSKQSGLSIWTKEHGLGFHINKDTIIEVANLLCDIANNPDLISKMKENSFNAYQENFSKRVICDKWSILLTQTVNYQHSISQ